MLYQQPLVVVQPLVDRLVILALSAPLVEHPLFVSGDASDELLTD